MAGGDWCDMEENLVAKYAAGTADVRELNRSIGETWRTALSNSQSRAEIAALLGVQENELDAENPPFRADIAHLSTFNPEIFITLTASRNAQQERYLDLWRKYIHEGINPPGSNRMGQERPLDEDEDWG
jgi:hypothetical protein